VEKFKSQKIVIDEKNGVGNIKWTKWI
jgi:hypothetical protein